MKTAKKTEKKSGMLDTSSLKSLNDVEAFITQIRKLAAENGWAGQPPLDFDIFSKEAVESVAKLLKDGNKGCRASLRLDKAVAERLRKVPRASRKRLNAWARKFAASLTALTSRIENL